MAAKKKPIPVVFRHYDILENVEGSFKAKCKHCTTTISGSTKATLNFLLNIKVLQITSLIFRFNFFIFQRKHELVYKEIKEIPRTQPSGSLQQSTLDPLVYNPKKNNMKDHHQVAITVALVTFKAGDLLPLSIVESPCFHDLMDVANVRYQVPS